MGRAPGAIGPQLGHFENFEPMDRPLRFSFKIDTRIKEDINVNLAEETHTGIEF